MTTLPAAGLVLIVEDDEGLRAILAQHLEHAAFDVVQVGSVEDATAALAAGLRPAAVVLDVNLPGDNGWDLLRGPELAAAGNPPVVIATGLLINPRRLEEFGVAGYLPKPFSVATLIDAVHRVMAREPRTVDA